MDKGAQVALPESYIVRVLRRRSGGGRALVGMIEVVRTRVVRPFRTAAELWVVITGGATTQTCKSCAQAQAHQQY